MKNIDYPERYFKVYKEIKGEVATLEKFEGMFKGSNPALIERIIKMYEYGGLKTKELTAEQFANLAWDECCL